MNLDSLGTALSDGIADAKPRPFDRLLLGPFLLWYAAKSKGMGRWPRRVLATAGIYQTFFALKTWRELAAAESLKDVGKVVVPDLVRETK